MPLLEPPDGLREKIVLIGGGGSGKTSCHLSIAWWAKVSGDTRKFYVMDTDDESVLQVMNEPKYDGLLHSVDGREINPDGNVVLHIVRDWPDYQKFSEMASASAVYGDWIVLDFVSHAWKAAQDGFIADVTQKKQSRDSALYDAGVAGNSGWDIYKGDVWNWQAINSSYDLFLKPILLKSRAHVFMTSEEEEIQQNSKMPAASKEHVAQFGAWKAAGAQKKLPYQCRTYLRTQRLARGRVLFTMKDRARTEYKGETLDPDFFSLYLKGAGWTVTDPA